MLTALAGILLGNLLIATLFGPALKELRQILMKFERIALPYRPLFDDKNASATDRQDAAEKAATKFNVLFRQYSMSFGAFKKVGLVFTAGIVGLGWLTISRLPVPNSFRILGAIGFAACIAAIGRFLQRAIARLLAKWSRSIFCKTISRISIFRLCSTPRESGSIRRVEFATL